MRRTKAGHRKARDCKLQVLKASMNVSGPERDSPEEACPISVIVPTYNRLDSLKICLEHLEDQTTRNFEVIVVDDGSTDSTRAWMDAYQAQGRLRLRYVFQQNAGPARARNVAIAMSRAPVCLMIGDDILVSRDFVQNHLALHESRPELQVAALGLTTWCDTRQSVTPFMRWLDESGMQFAYTDLQKGGAPSWRHFYTSNLSVKTETLRRFPFNEVFRKAATEDLELGYRIDRALDLELIFLPNASAKHLHPTSFLQSCRRMRGVGEGMRIFHQIRPELKGATSESRERMKNLVLGAGWLVAFVTAAGDRLTRFWCPNPLMRLALKFHYALGYRGERENPATRNVS